MIAPSATLSSRGPVHNAGPRISQASRTVSTAVIGAQSIMVSSTRRHHHNWRWTCRRHERCLKHHPWAIRTNPATRRQAWTRWCDRHTRCLRKHPVRRFVAGEISLNRLTGCTLVAAALWDVGLHNQADLIQATAIAIAESECQMIPNTEGSGCDGYFQTCWQIHNLNDSLLLSSPIYNAQAFMQVSDNATNWTPWDGDSQNGCVAGGWCSPVAYSSVNAVLRLAG